MGKQNWITQLGQPCVWFVGILQGLASGGIKAGKGVVFYMTKESQLV